LRHSIRRTALLRRTTGSCRAASRSQRNTRPCTPEFAELGEDEPDRVLDPFVGIELDAIALAPNEAWRQREPQRATAGLAVTGGQTTLAKKAEFVLRHRALQAE
jgi:hypothetical protein